MHSSLLRLAAILTFLPVAGQAADHWTQLKPGMTRQQTVAVLGAELSATKGRGFEVAIYDGRAEVVYLDGRLVAWTAPTSSQAVPAPADAWQFNQVRRSRVLWHPEHGSSSSGQRERRAPVLPAYRL